MVISDAASQGDGGKGDRALEIIDVKTSFLYGEIKDRVYIELPKEDPYILHILKYYSNKVTYHKYNSKRLKRGILEVRKKKPLTLQSCKPRNPTSLVGALQVLQP